ncbi:TniQ family protein [Dactylosporangium sp. CA-139066]|uniref:TniQ family protein n=1 Tax=Dactylosporangium sp. CA-139066 TaxID=3239930 RepID=UPI003D94F845
MLPRRVSPVSGETLTAYLARLATVNHLTVSEILTVLPTWFTTKANNPDERSQHHMLAPATTEALHALAHVTRTDHAGLARALPAFGSTGTRGPIRVATACPRCAARRGIHQTVPISLPVHDRVCTRHGVWRSDSDQPYLDVSATPRQPRTAVRTFYGVSLGVGCIFFTVSNGLAVWRITNHPDPLFAAAFAVILTGGAYCIGHLARGRWAMDWALWLMSLALITCLAWLGITGGAWHSEHLGLNAWGAGITLAVWGRWRR